MKKFATALDEKQKRSVEVDVTNTDRAVGTLLGAEITRRFGETLDEDTFTVKVTVRADRALVHSYLRDLRLNLSATATITSERAFQAVNLLYIRLQDVLIKKMKISS